MDCEHAHAYRRYREGECAPRDVSICGTRVSHKAAAMTTLGIAMDIGTSGFRAQALDLATGNILSTAITCRHPLPGANVIDHLHFALEFGADLAQRILVAAINRLIDALGIPTNQVVRLAVCGNPAQLSLFQGAEIRDLAYAGRRKLQSLDVTPPERTASIMAAAGIPGLALRADCEVVIPPAVRHEIGADALALIIQSGMLEKDEVSIAIDFGTNAEMAVMPHGTVTTGSAAAGPALEGQHISCGMLAMPGAICDLLPAFPMHRTMVLNAEMSAVPGPFVDLARATDAAWTAMPHPTGITGTGVIAVVHEAMEAGLIARPRIETEDRKLHLGDTIAFTEQDLMEAGKAMGALRAGQMALCQEAGVTLPEVHTAYLAGASGTYMDANKAMNLGIVPPRVQTVHHIGNTSLAMARNLVRDPGQLDALSELADRLKSTYCSLAASHTFKRVFILEFSYWTEGMPMSQYREFLGSYGLPDLPPAVPPLSIIRNAYREMDDIGRMGMKTLADIGRTVELELDGCILCGRCVGECPEKALLVKADGVAPTLVLKESECDGVACRRCERACPIHVLALDDFFLDSTRCAVGK